MAVLKALRSGNYAIRLFAAVYKSGIGTGSGKAATACYHRSVGEKWIPIADVRACKVA
jgi:hypothetical protein